MKTAVALIFLLFSLSLFAYPSQPEEDEESCAEDIELVERFTRVIYWGEQAGKPISQQHLEATSFDPQDISRLAETYGEDTMRLWDKVTFEIAGDLAAETRRGVKLVSGKTTRFEISEQPKSGLSELVRVANSLGYTVAYSPAILRRLSAMGVCNSSGKIIYISHRAFREFIVTDIELHELGHAYLDYLGQQGHATPFQIAVGALKPYRTICPNYVDPIEVTNHFGGPVSVSRYARIFEYSELYTFAVTLSAKGSQLNDLDPQDPSSEAERKVILTDLLSAAARYDLLAYQADAIAQALLARRPLVKEDRIVSVVAVLDGEDRVLEVNTTHVQVLFDIVSPELFSDFEAWEKRGVLEGNDIKLTEHSLLKAVTEPIERQLKVSREIQSIAREILSELERYRTRKGNDAWDFGRLIERCHETLRVANSYLPQNAKVKIPKLLQPPPPKGPSQ